MEIYQFAFKLKLFRTGNKFSDTDHVKLNGF